MRETRRVAARLCGHLIRVHKKRRGKVHPLCKRCMSQHPLEVRRCIVCGSSIVFSPIMQYIYAKKGLNLPSRCVRCNKDMKLFIRAIRMVMCRYRNSVTIDYKTVSRLGFPTNQLVCVLRGKRDRELVAEVCIEERSNGERIPVIKYVE